MTTQQIIWDAVIRYREGYERLKRTKDKVDENDDLRPLLHRLFRQAGLLDVDYSQECDILWDDPRVNLVGEIKTAVSPEFRPPIAGRGDWGWIKGQKPNQAGDGLAQLHREMKITSATYGIFTNGEILEVYEHPEPFGLNCYVQCEPIYRRCCFPERKIKECKLIGGTKQEIVPVFEFLLERWRR